MMKITGLSHLFKWENLHNWWLTKYFFAPLYILFSILFYCILVHSALTSLVHMYIVLIHSYLDLCVLGICCEIVRYYCTVGTRNTSVSLHPQ